MIPFRTQVKFFFENSAVVDQAAFAGLFQRWIQQKALEGLLIDVADYRHVFDGPGIILIGHENDYGIESRDGRFGLLLTRKRQTDPDLQAQLRNSLRLALAACKLIESEDSFRPPLKFRADEVEIRFADRLQLPNQPATFELVKNDLAAVLGDLYGTHPLTIEPNLQDSRYLFTVAACAEGVSSISELLQHLQAQLEK